MSFVPTRENYHVHRLFRFMLTLSLTFSAALLCGSSLAAAQPGGPCGLLTDARAFQTIKLPTLESCAIQDDSDNVMTIFHITGPISTGDTQMPGVPPGTPGTDIEKTPVDGIGDSAMLLRIHTDEGVLVVLRVQLGSDVYGFNAEDAPDASPRLMALARQVLSQAGG